MTQPTANRTRNPRSSVLASLCLLTLVVCMFRDLFIPSTRDVEVWFGLEVHGLWAMLTAPIHWAIFGIGAWAFWTEKEWAWPAAAGYLLYGGLAHLVWSEASVHGRGWQIGLLQALAISAMGWTVLRLRPVGR